MVTSAHTNQVGVHFLTETKVNRSYGNFYGHTFDDHTPYAVKTGYSAKPETRRGDRIHATPYHRYITRVTADKPSVWYWNQIDHGRVVAEQTLVKHMSVDVANVSVYPPDEFIRQMEDCYSGAITKSLNGLRGKNGTVQNGVDIAEARKTANMIATDMMSVLNAYRAVRRGNVSEAFHHLGWKGSVSSAAANRWLEYIYGWLPLLGAVHDNVQLLDDISKRKGNKSVVSERTGGRRSLSHVRQVGDIEYTWVVTGNVRSALSATIYDETLVNLDTFGLLNPFSVAWELVPYSFVVDWFVPVGNTLSALSASAGLSFADGYVSDRREGVLKCRRRGPGWIDPGDLTIQWFEFVRSPHSGFPLPETYTKNNPFTTTHITNALALLVSAQSDR